jgi:NAD(P)-dependent dehydrogenase (short-subunit alcohol dehydrogenase family)
MGTGSMQAEIGAAIAGYDRLAPMFMNMLPVDVTEPRDVADTVLFLASDESKFITAQRDRAGRRRHRVLSWPAHQT